MSTPSDVENGGGLAPAAQPARKRDRSPAVVALAIACGVLLLAAVGLGGTAAWLWGERSRVETALAASEKRAAEQAEALEKLDIGAKHQLEAFEVVVISDLELSDPVVTAPDRSGFVALYAPIVNENEEQAADVFFDVTAYSDEGRIIARTPASVYLLPGQTSLFRGILTSDMLEAETIRIEQTSLELQAPSVTGGVVLDSLAASESGYVEGQLTSTLSQASSFSDLFLVGFVDDKIFAVCSDFPEIPANGAFTASCDLEYASENPSTAEEVEIPEDAIFDAFLALERP